MSSEFPAGWHVFPIWPLRKDGTCQCPKAGKCTTAGKHPVPWLVPNGVKNASDDPKVIAQWRKEFDGEPNWAVATGQISGIFGIDIDGRHDGFSSLEVLQTEIGTLPKTVTCQTGSGDGEHIYFRYPEGTKIPNGVDVWSGIDTRSNGGYLIIPPSKHVSGGEYAWIANPNEVDLADIPETLLAKILQRHKEAEQPSRGDDSERMYKGMRNISLTRVAGSMRARGHTANEIYDVLKRRNAERCSPPLPEPEVRRIAQSIVRYAPREIRSSLTDIGNGERLTERYGGILRRVPAWKSWLVWNGAYWVREEDDYINEFAKETGKSVYDEISLVRDMFEASEDEAEREELAKLIETLPKWGKTSQDAYRVKAMVDMARTDDRLRLPHTDLDKDPMLLTVGNGTLDLKTGELRPHRQRDYITQSVGVNYDAGAEAPTWDRFMESLFPDKPETQSYIQRFVGYCLTGDVSEQCLAFFYGTGANGKTTFLNTIKRILGTYSVRVSSQILLKDAKWGREGGERDKPRLRGARLAITSETAQTSSFDEANLKDITGGDPIDARYLYGEKFEFDPTHKLIVYGNHKPRINSTDEGTWRRIHLVPFDQSFMGERRDPTLAAKLWHELPGILNWAVRGCLAWQETGLAPPSHILQATKEYREGQDDFGQFIEDCLDEVPDSRAPAQETFDTYQGWAEDNGVRFAMNQRQFRSAMEERGHARIKKGGNFYYIGLSISESK